jgi:Flp pilus assembly protein TadG
MSHPRVSRWRQRLATARAARERGSLTLMLAILMVALIALAGIVIDGGDKLTAAENANAIAQEAARAGAGQVSTTTAYADGRFVINRQQAVSAAYAYLAAAGYHGHVSSAGNSITVSVRVTQPTKVLSIIDIRSFHVQGEATARLAAGVTGPGR